MSVLPEIVAYDFPKHSKEAAGAKFILVPGENGKKLMPTSLRSDIRK